jgi:UDP-N-acetyl-D-mannosaminuronic acid dehydrogenase
MLNRRLHVIHAPHRWYALEEKEHGVNQLRVIGRVFDCCLGAGLEFYSGSITNTSAVTNNNAHEDNTPLANQDHISCKYNSKHKYRTNGTNINFKNSLDVPMHPVSQIEIAETIKVVENAHRYLQIAFAEELFLYCHAYNISFPELRDALNTKWNVNILEPREGKEDIAFQRIQRCSWNQQKEQNT